VRTFRDALEEAIRRPDSLRAWYLSVVNELARRGRVETVSVRGLWWREIDALEDLEEVRASYARVAAEAAAAPRDAALAAR
jgi:choline kinase